MKEYISREDALNFEMNIETDPDRIRGIMEGMSWYAEQIKSIPAANVAPVRHGIWIWDKDGMDWGLGAWRCSACGNRPGTWWQSDRKAKPMRCSGSSFCGNCGAKMEVAK